MVVLLLGASLGGAMLLSPDHPSEGPVEDPESPVATTPTNDSFAMVTADSEAAFRAYMAAADRRRRPDLEFTGAGDAVAADGAETATAVAAEAAQPSVKGGDGVRYGETNVQVEGVDEPDILKTVDGRFYYSGPGDVVERHHGEDTPAGGETVVVNATDPGEAAVTAHIDRSGRMLVADERVVVLGEEAVTGYDVTDPDDPELVWERDVSGRVTAARLYQGRVYLVVAEQVGEDCRVEPLNGESVHCTDIHHPERPLPVDVTYTALALDATDGTVRDTHSFVGGSRATVYMSTDGLYVTYLERASETEIRLEFLLSDTGRALLDDRAVAHLEEIRGYDLSPRARRAEVRATVERWLQRVEKNRRDDLGEALEDGYRRFLRDRKRGLERTHIVRLSLDGGLTQTATGTVPGRVNDQFSFDVHDGHLRVATTVGEGHRIESANDVYVLDVGTLSVVGKVTGMGQGQRVYGVRFVGDRGYVITFRQVDPLHVLDLSDPTDPEQAGSLKLPGFSRYLHPLDDGRVLGIGEEDGEVKAVIFDVSDPSNPRIAHSRVLDARYSAIQRTHHAFMRDPRHDVVFLPTQRGGYILSEQDLSTVRKVDVTAPQRARYAGDYLYVFGAEEVAVLNERTWTRTTTVELNVHGVELNVHGD